MEGIDNIDAEVKRTVASIKKLEEEIVAYQTGLKSFKEAAEAMKQMSMSEKAVATELAASAKMLTEMDAVKLTEKVKETTTEMVKMSEELDMLFDRIEKTEKVLKGNEGQLLDYIKKELETTENKMGVRVTKVEKIVAGLDGKASDLDKKVSNLDERLDVVTKSMESMMEKMGEAEKRIELVGKQISKIDGVLEAGVKVKRRWG